MAITNARMQMRRGLEADFDPDKMRPGEWAVSLDKKYVRMCFSVGVCVRMATYDAFEEDMAQIEEILSKCETIEEAVAKINTEVSANAQAVEEYTEQAKKYRDEAKQFRDEAETFKPDGYVELKQTVASNTAKIDTIIEKAELNIKNTASGENIHLTDSANSKVVEFWLYGKAEQFVGTITDDEGNEISVPNPDYPQEITVSGESYNLLENTATHKEENGVVFVVNEDKSISVSGTSTVETALKTAENTLDNGEYILSGRSTSLYVRLLGYNSENTWVKIAETNNSDNVLFTIDNSIYSKILVQTIARNNATFNNETIYPMIRKASVKNDRYMPYGKGSVEVKSVGNQLFNANEVEIGKAWNNANNTARAIEVIECKPNTTYTITCDSTLFDGIYYFQKVNKTDTTQIGDGGIIRNNLTITTNENANFLIIQFNKDSVSKTDIENAKVMINEGETALPYEPYTETTSTIPTPNGLCGIKVSSGGNYTDKNGQMWITDEIVKYADGSGSFIQRIGKVELPKEMTNYEVNTSVGELGNFFTLKVDSLIKETSAIKLKTISTHFRYGNPYSEDGELLCAYIYSGGGIRFRINDVKTLNELSTWLETNDVKVLYELYEPITTPLTAEEIAEIEKLHTFYPVTNISNDADCGMSITYKADAQNYIDNRLALIESAMLNNI